MSRYAGAPRVTIVFGCESLDQDGTTPLMDEKVRKQVPAPATSKARSRRRR